MIYLILAVISSTAISVVMRLSDKYVKNNMTMFASNYLICGLLSFAFLLADSGTASLTVSGVSGKEFAFALVLGLAGGILYLVSFSKEDFEEFNEILLPNKEDIEIYKWSDDFSDYFDAGKEWWGTGLWTAFDLKTNTVVVIGASLTD